MDEGLGQGGYLWVVGVRSFQNGSGVGSSNKNILWLREKNRPIWHYFSVDRKDTSIDGVKKSIPSIEHLRRQIIYSVDRCLSRKECPEKKRGTQKKGRQRIKQDFCSHFYHSAGAAAPFCEKKGDAEKIRSTEKVIARKIDGKGMRKRKNSGF